MNKKPHTYTWIFFDLDSTLMDFHNASHQSVQDLMQQHGHPFTEDIYQIYHKHNLSVWHAFERNEIDALRLRALRFELFLNEMGWNYDAKLWGKKYLEGIVKHSKLLKHAENILDYSREKYKIAAVTNGLREVQRPRLRKCGIYEKFDHIIVSDEIGHSKPDIAFFEHCFDKIGPYKKSEILIVGDSLSSDIKGGLNAGIHTCWYDINDNQNELAHKPEVHYRITSLDQLKDII